MIKQKAEKYKCFRQDSKGILWFGDRLVVPKDPELRKKILDEAHLSKFSMHPDSNKMYQDLRSLYWWTRMKREIAKYISECDTCQRIKASHLKAAGPLQPLPIPSWKWEDICIVGPVLRRRRSFRKKQPSAEAVCVRWSKVPLHEASVLQTDLKIE